MNAYLGLLQFFFLLSWTVYVVFLGDLLTLAGAGKDLAPKLLLADQLVFAVMDVLLGRYADGVQNLLKRLTPALLALNLVACLILVALPSLASMGTAVLVSATLIWVASSTVLRAPLYGAIARRHANPLNASAWALAGLGLASAAAPYLGTALKGVDPSLPFALSGAALAAATLGFGRWETHLQGHHPTMAGGADVEGARKPPGTPGIGGLFVVMLCLGLGFQLHFFVNAAYLFKQVADTSMLAWLMPVFWIGFSISVFPGARWIARSNPGGVLLAGAVAGTLASLGCAFAPGLAWLMVLQGLAGASWGACFLAALDLAGRAGRRGRESLCVGLIFAALALVTALRIGGVAFLPHSGSGQYVVVAPVLWGVGALLSVLLFRTQITRGASLHGLAQH